MRPPHFDGATPTWRGHSCLQRRDSSRRLRGCAKLANVGRSADAAGTSVRATSGSKKRRAGSEESLSMAGWQAEPPAPPRSESAKTGAWPKDQQFDEARSGMHSACQAIWAKPDLKAILPGAREISPASEMPAESQPAARLELAAFRAGGKVEEIGGPPKAGIQPATAFRGNGS
jgi:hypothetical protein